VYVKGADLPPVIEDLVRHHDEPFSDAANIPLYLLSRELNGTPRVVLQGDGGDEIFGGYRRYALLSQFKFWKALSSIGRFMPTFGSDKLSRLVRILDAFGRDEPGHRMALLLTMDTPRSSFVDILSEGWKVSLRGTDPYRRYCEMAQRLRSLDPVQQMLYCDVNILLPDVFLEKVDKPTMSFGIESRVPFLDNELTEYVMGLPAAVKVSGNKKKRLLKQSLRGVIPDDILDAPKSGFSVPYSYWLSNSLYGYAQEMFKDATVRNDAFFDRTALFGLIARHKRNASHRTGFILWKALNLAIWQKQYLT
jgi:asparagine synthase (glutamine-hydrolysing)